MELSTVKDAFDRVIKKRKLSYSKFQDVIDQVAHEIEQALAKVQSVSNPMPPVDLSSILTELKIKLNALIPVHQLEGSQKELNGNLSRFPKVLEKSFIPDISKAYRNVDVDFHTVNQIIAHHFYREGLFDLGDCLINESAEEEQTVLRSQFLEMHQIVEAMKLRNLEPALNWASANRERLRQNGSKLELKLHCFQYLEILKKGNRADALAYARTYLSPFASLYIDEVQKLVTTLLWVGRLDRSPYTNLISPSNWDKLTDELIRQFYIFMGQPYKSPFLVAMSAGFEGLPTLLKLAYVMAMKRQEWQEMKQMPIPVDLGKEFQFHSIFVCPVSRDQSNEENPPMLLPCLHVLCKQSIMKLSKNSPRMFKCPYCPAQTSAAECMQLYL